MHNVSQSVKGGHIVAHLPSDDEIRTALRNMQPYMRIRDFDKLPGGPSYRTVYRQLEPEPPEMRADVRDRLIELLEEIDYTVPDPEGARGAARRLRGLIAARAAAVARAEQEIEAKRVSDAEKKRRGKP